MQVAERVPFEAKWRLLARVGVRCYILISNVSGAVKVAPLQILQFPVILPHKFQDAEKFNLRFSDASEITEIADKLRWYRYQKGLRQRDAADYAGIDRSTYIHYEEAGRDFYPKEHMEKLAELFEVPLEDLLDDYNLFLLVFVGVITGVGGGVLRDVLSNQKPYIFVKHFYACPTLIGALLCALCWRHLGDIPSMLLGAAVILVLRLCAAHFRWGLPHAADLPE